MDGFAEVTLSLIAIILTRHQEEGSPSGPGTCCGAQSKNPVQMDFHLPDRNTCTTRQYTWKASGKHGLQGHGGRCG